MTDVRVFFRPSVISLTPFLAVPLCGATRSGILTSRLISALCRTASKALGGDKRDRTADPLLAKQVLSQLSYTPISRRGVTLKIKHQ